MSAEAELMLALIPLRGDHLAQIERLKAEIKELEWVHRVSCTDGNCHTNRKAES